MSGVFEDDHRRIKRDDLHLLSQQSSVCLLTANGKPGHDGGLRSLDDARSVPLVSEVTDTRTKV